MKEKINSIYEAALKQIVSDERRFAETDRDALSRVKQEIASVALQTAKNYEQHCLLLSDFYERSWNEKRWVELRKIERLLPITIV